MDEVAWPTIEKRLAEEMKLKHCWFSPDGSTIAFPNFRKIDDSEDGNAEYTAELCLWDCVTGEVRRVDLGGSFYDIGMMGHKMSTGGRYLLFYFAKVSIFMFDVRLPGIPDPERFRTGKSIITVYDLGDNPLNPQTGRFQHLFHGDAIASIVFNEDKLLAVSKQISEENVIRTSLAVWDLENFEEIQSTLEVFPFSYFDSLVCSQDVIICMSYLIKSDKPSLYDRSEHRIHEIDFSEPATGTFRDFYAAIPSPVNSALLASAFIVYHVDNLDTEDETVSAKYALCLLRVDPSSDETSPSKLKLLGSNEVPADEIHYTHRELYMKLFKVVWFPDGSHVATMFPRRVSQIDLFKIDDDGSSVVDPDPESYPALLVQKANALLLQTVGSSAGCAYQPDALHISPSGNALLFVWDADYLVSFGKRQILVTL